MLNRAFSVFILICAINTFVFAQSTSPRGGTAYDGKAQSTTSDTIPEEIKNVGIDEKIGQTLDLNLQVTDDTGKKVLLSSYFHPHKPILLSPMYYSCPGLCSFHFNGVIDSLKKIDWNPGDKFQVIAFSFDANENKPEHADLGAKKKANYMKLYGRPGTEKGFHFVTADQATIDKLMSAIGFRYKWNEKIGEWAHVSAAIMISPEGKITRYLHGIEFNPRDMKLALNETSNGKVGNIVDSVLLYCFKFDKHESKYG
ncbi:MAG: SCO family protein, partial [Bdellovibrionaceae bacterium]|nr:SCO family protein [Pseudobdellovibrionaceae bacterium]